ncbi:MAG TPA: citrate lyase holo-[acyl-carrier protein] synthase [Clostridiales bacterium]|nr:citrate lyase holo-[acyl-carrier protein] synthase [Clostridiales bacterium]
MTEIHEQILVARERRSERIGRALSAFPADYIVSITLNIPGPEKVLPAGSQLIQLAQDLLLPALTDCGCAILHQECHSGAAGVAALLVASPGPVGLDDSVSLRKKIKRLLVEIEETDPLGRLLDLDLWQGQEQVKRSELGLPPRPCLICEKPAVLCARSQSHPWTQLRERIDRLLQSDPRLCHNQEVRGE